MKNFIDSYIVLRTSDKSSAGISQTLRKLKTLETMSLNAA